jgi:site-specific DNA-methyltransferase (adenine-specific)
MLNLDKIYCGDCVTLCDKLPDDSINLTVTSPPYDPVVRTNEGKLVTQSRKGLRHYKGYAWDFVAIAEQLYRITKPGGVVVWVVNDQTLAGSETGSSFRQALEFTRLGFNLHDTMIYRRAAIPLNHRRYEQHFEYMFVLSKGRPAVFNPIMVLKKYKDNRKFKATHRHKGEGHKTGFVASWTNTIIKGNVWDIPAGGGVSTKDKYAFQHPAIFPEVLARDHILSWSSPGDTVLDPFVGSGTVPKMCVLTGRHYLGFDISSEYVKIAQRRVRDAQRQPMLLGRAAIPINNTEQLSLLGKQEEQVGKNSDQD